MPFYWREVRFFFQLFADSSFIFFFPWEGGGGKGFFVRRALRKGIHAIKRVRGGDVVNELRSVRKWCGGGMKTKK